MKKKVPEDSGVKSGARALTAGEAAKGKKAQRTVLRLARNRVGKREREEAARAVVPLFCAASRAQRVGLYYPVRGEFDCLPLLTVLAGQGVQTALPVVTGRGQGLEFRAWRPGDELQPGDYKIPAPGNKSLSIVPQVLIVPLLGYDASGARLGYGGGYYDRTLQDLRLRNGAFEAVGLAYDFQKLDKVAVEAHDQKLDAILTPAGYHRF